MAWNSCHCFFVRASIWLQAWQISDHTRSYVAVLQLSELELSYNKLTGTLPSAWGSLEQVRTLYMLLPHITA